MNKNEFNRLNDRLDQNHKIRNELLTFSFTSVIAVLAAVFAIQNPTSSTYYLLLLPYVILIPFQARLSYYRMEDAHVRAYFEVYAPEYDAFYVKCRRSRNAERERRKKSKHQLSSSYVGEEIGMGRSTYLCVSWMINHELVLLGIVIAAVLWIKEGCDCSAPAVAARMISLIAIIIIWWLSEAVWNYGKVFDKYLNAWREYKKTEYEQQKPPAGDWGKENHLSSSFGSSGISSISHS